jgi:hypothetical protein
VEEPSRTLTDAFGASSKTKSRTSSRKPAKMSFL